MRLPKPYSTDEIQKKPFPVLISVLIGLLLTTTGGWMNENSSGKRDLKECNDRAYEDQQERIKMYDRIYGLEVENAQLKSEQQETDSSFRAKTGTNVNRLLRRPR